ncbi:uncharacterized protein LOC142177315 [Nicotiana tabacum]|uniref:Uncharacterized protein LOC142177315 n=1 Tax=Nicotiana tabacum TaxID=4097 RepID=A0AC58TXE5_TOBAC
MVKTIRSDNEGEFVNYNFTALLRELGIVHQRTCVYTPQRNGIAERKRRYILEVARAIRFHGHIPVRFWGHCVLAVIVLPRQDKFSAGAVRAVLMGHSNVTKGYLLYNLEKKEFFINKYVTFKEGVIPFKDIEGLVSPTSCQEGVSPTSCQEGVYPNHPSHFADVDSNIPISIEDALQPPVFQHDASPSSSHAGAKSNAAQDSITPPVHTNKDEIFEEPELYSSDTSTPLRRSGQVTKQPLWLTDYVVPLPAKKSHFMANYLSYDQLSSSHKAYLGVFLAISEPTSFYEACNDVRWIEGDLDDENQSDIVVILVYVDDILIAGNNQQMIYATKDSLHKAFRIKDLGELKFFLKMEFNRSSRGILVNQRKYALEIISELGIGDAKPAWTPLEVNVKLTVPEYDKLIGNEDDNALEDKGQYQRLIGKLLYLTLTRPDIAYTVQALSQFLQQPKKSHWDAAMRVARYIKREPGLGMLFSIEKLDKIYVFCDAD